MKRSALIIVLGLAAFLGASGSAVANGNAPKRCVQQHRHRQGCCARRQRDKHGCPPRRTPSEAGSKPASAPTPTSPGPTNATPTELVVRLVGAGGPPGAPSAELIGEIAVYDGARLVTEQSTSLGPVVVPVSPGLYKVTAAWEPGQEPCGEQEVTVGEAEQLDVDVGCVIN